MKTIGYRATGITFHTIKSDTGKTPVAVFGPGTNYIVRAQGPLIKTDNPLDVAVNGEGWLAIQTPAGKAYTRDGRMQMQPNGSLQTIDGYSVLDAGGAPIQLDPAGGRVVIGKDGMISQRGNQIGALGLFMIPSSDAVHALRQFCRHSTKAGDASARFRHQWRNSRSSRRLERQSGSGDGETYDDLARRRQCQRSLLEYANLFEGCGQDARRPGGLSAFFRRQAFLLKFGQWPDRAERKRLG